MKAQWHHHIEVPEPAQVQSTNCLMVNKRTALNSPKQLQLKFLETFPQSKQPNTRENTFAYMMSH